MGQFLRIGFVAEAMTRLPDGISTDDLSGELAQPDLAAKLCWHFAIARF
jgi:hypothetical protein